MMRKQTIAADFPAAVAIWLPRAPWMGAGFIPEPRH